MRINKSAEQRLKELPAPLRPYYLVKGEIKINDYIRRIKTNISRRKTLSGRQKETGRVNVQHPNRSTPQENGEINSTTKDIEQASKVNKFDDTDQKSAKNATRKWKAGVEKDRYDVNKSLNSLIIHTKDIAKGLPNRSVVTVLPHHDFCFVMNIPVIIQLLFTEQQCTKTGTTVRRHPAPERN